MNSDAAELLALLETEARVRSARSLADYARIVMDTEPAAHHELLIAHLEAVERGELDVLIVTMPPGSAKSFYCSVAFPAWYLGRHPDRCVIAASHTQELAERFGRRVRNLVSQPEHTNVFPLFALAPDSSAAGRWDTTRGGEYFAAGVGGSITGRRADLAIIDDPVKSREEADSQTIREKQWAWWRDDLTTRLKPGAAVVVIMTRWHEDDLAGRLLTDLSTARTRYKLLNLPMEAEENDALGREPGDLLWPEWFTPQMVEQAKREPRTWSALYQQSPRPIGGGELQKAWLLRWTTPPATGQRIIVVDPASGKSKTRGDYTSMWVVGAGPDGNDYVVDGVRDRLNLTERSEALFDLVRRWKPAAVGYEEYGLQADIEHIRLEQERQQYRFRIIPLGGRTKKEDRIRRLAPGFQGGRTWLPQSLVKRLSTGHQHDIMQDFLDEYVSFPVGAHDDALDCLARKEEPEMRRFLTTPQRESMSIADAMQTSFTPFDAVAGY